MTKTTSRKPDSVSSVNMTPAAPVSERTMRCTPADKATSAWSEALVDAGRNGAVVVTRGEHFLDRVQDVVQPVDVEEGLLLAGEGRVRQVFGGGRSGLKDMSAGVGDQALVLGGDLDRQRGQERRLDDPLRIFSPVATSAFTSSTSSASSASLIFLSSPLCARNSR